MKTPRLVFLALWAMLAPLSAAAGETWDPVLQSGDDWKSVSFTDENGASRFYWFRADAKGEHVPLYILTPKKNAAVTGGSFYESKTAGYEVKVIVVPSKGRNSQATTSYVVTRAGTNLELSGTPSWSLGAQDWDKTHPPVYEERTGRGGKTKVLTNPYVAGTVKVLVNAPGDAQEKLDPSPMTNFKQGVAAVSWDDFYFERAPRAATTGRNGSDPDAGYRRAKESFGPLHRSVLPFEVILEPNNCFIRPETCTDEQKAVDQKYIQAGIQTKAGNNLLTENLALAGHAEYKARAQAFKGLLESSPDSEFTAKETSVLQRLLVNTGQTAAFQTALNAARAKPETLKAFVHKWRHHLIKEVDLYIVASDAAKSSPINFAAERKGLNERAQQTAAAPLTATPGPKVPAGPVTWCDPKAGKTTLVPPGAAPAGGFIIPKAGACVVGQRPPAPVAKTWCNPKDGKKTVVPPGTAPLGSFVIAKGGACAVGQKAPAVVDANPKLPLTAAETRWLTKRQQADLTDPPAARAAILKNLEPDATAVAGYGALIDAPTAAAIEAALPKKLWGGDVTTVLKSSGTNTGVQLSEADYDALKKKDPAAIAKFDKDYSSANGDIGQSGKPVFSAKDYDPIQLHLLVEAARKALGSSGTRAGGTTGSGTVTGPVLPLLTDEQKKRLSPVELANYEAILKSANGNVSDRSLQDILKTLTARTEARKGSPYPEAGLAEKDFDTAPDWQKDKLCGPKALGASVAAGTTTGAAEVVNTADAKAGLEATAAAQNKVTRQAATPPAGARPPWADKKCKGYPFFKEPVVATTPIDASLISQPVGGDKKAGGDKEIAAKEKSQWVTQDLIVSGAKGAMTGLLIGSLFGPVGLILGPLIGAAIFYGVTKLTS
jgi:hypothetical protein